MRKIIKAKRLLFDLKVHCFICGGSCTCQSGSWQHPRGSHYSEATALWFWSDFLLDKYVNGVEFGLVHRIGSLSQYSLYVLFKYKNINFKT